MTDLAKRKEEAKKEIRSLLLSAPLGLTVVELKRDFAEFIGHPLPWKELGYSSAEDFVQDIPDTVKITWSNTGMVLTGVANSSTKHIEKLVQNQKVDTRLKKKVMDRRSRQAAKPLLPLNRGYMNAGYGQNRAYYSQRPPRFNNTNIGYLHYCGYSAPAPVQYPHQSHARQRARHMAPPPCVPAYTRGQISQLLSQHKQGLPLTHFCSIFRSRFGVPLDFREMGFSTEQDLLSSLRDILGMRTLAGGETRVMSLEACVAWDLSKWRGDAIPTGPYHQQGNTNSSLKPKMLQNNNVAAEPKPLKPLINPLVQPDRLSRGKGRGRGAIRKDTSTSKYEEDSIFEDHKISTAHQAEQVSPLRSTELGVDEHCNIPVSVQNEITQIMNKRPKGVCASRLPFEYKEMFKRPLPTKTYGYNSVIEFVSDLPHIVRIERPYPQGDWFLFPVQVSNGDNCSSSLPKLKVPATSSAVDTTTTPSPPPLEVDKALKEAIAQVMSINSEGIPLNKFQETFQAVTGKPLNVARYGPGGLKRILHGMSDILIISLDASDKAIVLPKMHNTPRRFDQLQDQFQPIATGGGEAASLMHLPQDAVSPGCKYRPQPLPAPSANGEDYIELYVSNVLSPDMFWIQLRGRKTTLALEDLMDELEAVYSSKSLPKEYYMTPQLAQKGMLCAVIFPEDCFWHRGYILGLKDQLYQVYYVDYGNTCLVSIDQMRLLKSKFLKLPAQAIQARLGHIKPINGVWKSNATQRMLALAREKPLVGLVVAEKDRVLSLCLTDTSREEDIHFNDMFVDEGYAVFEPESGVVQAPLHEQAPSSFMLFGDVAKDEGMHQDGIQSMEEPIHRYVRQAQMTDELTMNLVNFHDQLYLMASEISALFSHSDVVSKLQQDNVHIETVVAEKKVYPDLFKELLLYEAHQVDEYTESLNLLPLDRLPLIIELYSQGNKHEGLKAMALELLEWFDPQDPYWKGLDDAMSSASQTSDNEDEGDAQTQSTSDEALPSLEDLQEVLKTLEIKRKRILSRMLSEAPTPDCVNELNTVELHISRMEALISKLETESPASSISLQQQANHVSHPQSSLNSKQHVQNTNIPVSQPTKTTHKVAPMIQSPQQPHQVNSSHQQNLKMAAGSANPTSIMPSVDLLLQQQMLMNQLMMQQLGLSTQNTPFSGQLPGQLPSTNPSTAQVLPGFGRGVLTSSDADQLQQQHQQLQLLQNQLLQQSGSGAMFPGLGNSALLNSRLFSQQTMNPQFSNFGMLSSGLPLSTQSPAQATMSATSSLPPGLSMLGVSGLARGRGMNSQPQTGAVSSQPSGLQPYTHPH